ncbi:MAG TPA: cob(I)yrinic acid a,c-diamide adenosyltransferase [Candidatus Tripitaka californicus]|uniref:cob(I)yrinic acid a,c-diamide adenosyltransferase n=1 Tax=Candidatus Tripitaka californicus TaxID=3367616 RepID=UPI004029BB48|nr:cob(I)yrinic acid a,c-diamide adenosyltransferase [Planctomycetota bacterium]
MQRRGTVQVYTGEGKGKTTAALGQALRAVGHGWKVIVIQFLKARQGVGEIAAAKDIPNLHILQFGSGHFVCNKPTQEDQALAQQAWQKAREATLSGEYDMVILDEINVAIHYKMIAVQEVLKLVEERPPHVELILTGRYAHPKLLEVADLVSEIKAVKHPYTSGVKAREGIEY